MKRTAFFISDGTGITAETLGQSLLAQFGNIDFRRLMSLYNDTDVKAQAMVQQNDAVAENEQVQLIVSDTIVITEIRDILSTANVFKVDIFSSFLAPLEEQFDER